MAHLTGLAYTEDEIDEFVKQLEDAGIENVLALRGDINPNAPSKGVFNHASELISYMKPRTSMCIAGACYPEDHPESTDHISEMKNLKKKVDAGAEVLVSQLFFNNKHFYSFVEDARIAGIDVPITPGIMPAIRAAQLQRMISTCGAILPPAFAKIIDKYGDNDEAMYDAGMAYAMSQIIDLLTNGVDGIHLYTMNKPKVARTICDGIKNIINV